jgi:hypothetical protein
VATPPQHQWPITFDPCYTQPAFCRFVDNTLKGPSVGTLVSEDRVVLKQGPQPLAAFDAQRQQEHWHAIKEGGQIVHHL